LHGLVLQMGAVLKQLPGLNEASPEVQTESIFVPAG
jgi:hypothetical protein